MKFSILFLILFIGGGSNYKKNQLPKNVPTHLEIELDWKKITKSQLVFDFKNSDTLLTHQMNLLYNEEDLPLLYYADITTPVCIDGLCKPVYIEMYWDLLGQYVGYGEYPSEALSKFDHEDFESEDYLKLHNLLLDHNSILGRRKLTDLYDIKQEREVAVTFKGIEVDGVSGATKEEVKTAIVDGALYSCFTLWHLANENVRTKINEHLPKIYTRDLAVAFLNSENESYQYRALKEMPKNEYKANIEKIVPILLNSKTLTRSYGLKKMPDELYSLPFLVQELYGNFSSLDFNSRTLLIDRLKHSTSATALLLTNDIGLMSKNQLKSFLNILKDNEHFQTADISNSLHPFSIDNTFLYNYMVSEYLDSSN